MSILKQLEARRAYRALDSRPIAKETLERLAAAAHLSPSAANNQPWRVVTVVDHGRLVALKATLTPGNYWAKKSPAIAAFVTSPDWDLRLDGGRDFALFALGAATMSYQLQAVEEGLVAHPIAGFNAPAAKELLGVPEGAVLEVLVVLGFPGDVAGLNEKHLESEKGPRIRKPIAEVAAFDAWDSRLVPPAKK